MHPAEFSILLHRALEARLGRLLELASREDWRLDPEGLHEVRVASRRARAVLELVDPAIYPKYNRHLRRLKALTGALGASREHDVHLALLAAQPTSSMETATLAALEHAQELLDHSRRRAQKHMARALARLNVAECAGLLRVPSLPDPFAPGDAPASARACLEPKLRAALEPISRLSLQEDAPGMHALRILVKKTRYSLEILAPVVEGQAEPVLDRLRELQTILGDHHDLATLEGFLWNLHEGLAARNRTLLAEGLLDVVGRVAEARRTGFDRFRELAPRLDLEGFLTTLWPSAPSPECAP